MVGIYSILDRWYGRRERHREHSIDMRESMFICRTTRHQGLLALGGLSGIRDRYFGRIPGINFFKLYHN